MKISKEEELKIAKSVLAKLEYVIDYVWESNYVEFSKDIYDKLLNVRSGIKKHIREINKRDDFKDILFIDQIREAAAIEDYYEFWNRHNELKGTLHPKVWDRVLPLFQENGNWASNNEVTYFDKDSKEVKEFNSFFRKNAEEYFH